MVEDYKDNPDCLSDELQRNNVHDEEEYAELVDFDWHKSHTNPRIKTDLKSVYAQKRTPDVALKLASDDGKVRHAPPMSSDPHPTTPSPPSTRIPFLSATRPRALCPTADHSLCTGRPHTYRYMPDGWTS